MLSYFRPILSVKFDLTLTKIQLQYHQRSRLILQILKHRLPSAATDILTAPRLFEPIFASFIECFERAAILLFFPRGGLDGDWPALRCVSLSLAQRVVKKAGATDPLRGTANDRSETEGAGPVRKGPFQMFCCFQ